jgi:hypothetical protein
VMYGGLNHAIVVEGDDRVGRDRVLVSPHVVGAVRVDRRLTPKWVPVDPPHLSRPFDGLSGFVNSSSSFALTIGCILAPGPAKPRHPGRTNSPDQV